MALTRVSTYSLHQNTLSDALSVQSRLAKLQNQVSSGQKSDNFEGLNGQVEIFIQLEAKMRKTQTFIDNNTVLKSRMQTMDVSLQQLIEIADDFQDLTVQARNPVASESMQFEVAARALIEAAAGQLNVSQEGRYLFSGSKTDTQPITVPVPGSITPGVPDDGYYQGNNQVLTSRIQEQTDMEYGVLGNDPAFQKLFAAMNLGLQAFGSGSDTTMGAASELVTEAVQEIIALRARVQQNTVNLEEVNSRHTQLNLYWKGVTEDISKTDILSASTEIAVSEAVLTAAFQSFASLNQLRLTDYLR